MAKSATKRAEKPVAKAARQSKPTTEITAAEADALLDNAGEQSPKSLAETVALVKKRKPSAKPRDDDGRVLRKGHNLSGNQPFRRKPYYYDLDQKKAPDYDAAFNKAPMQVRLMLRYMEEQGITTPDDAMIGAEVAGGAINSGKLQSKIDPAALFAYYRRVMETLGLRLASGDEE